MRGDTAVFGRLVQSLRQPDSRLRRTGRARPPAGVLVCGQGVLLPVFVRLGAGNAAALPLRPVDGIRMEISSAACNCERAGNQLDPGFPRLVSYRPAASFASRETAFTVIYNPRGSNRASDFACVRAIRAI